MTEEGRPSTAMTVHATAIVVGETGVLIRGPSGSGKSTLAREVIAASNAEGRFSRLVADDRVALSFPGRHAVARPVPPLAGLLEIRGIGLVPVPYEPAALIQLVVDISDDVPRMPDRLEEVASIGDVALPRILVNVSSAPSVVLWRLRAHYDVLVTVP